MIHTVIETLGRRHRQYRHAIQEFAKAKPAERRSLLDSWITRGEPTAAVWYLCGYLELGENHMRDAARAFGMAYHADCDVQTAALLTFSGLKASEGPNSDILERIVQTWYEMKQPVLFSESADRVVIDGLAAIAPPSPECSALGQLAWTVVSSRQRDRLATILTSPPTWAQSLVRMPV